MKSIMILIVAAGLSSGGGGDAALEVRELEFKNLVACKKAAAALTAAADAKLERTLAVMARAGAARVSVAPPTVVAYCTDR